MPGDRFVPGIFVTNVGDIIMAAEYLSAQFRAPRILIGHSMGGTAILQAAERIETSEFVVTIGSPAQPGHVGRVLRSAREVAMKSGSADIEISGRRFQLKNSFFEDLENADIKKVLAALHKEVMIFHSDKDEIVSVDNGLELFEAARHTKNFISLGSANHLLTDPKDAEYVAAIISARGKDQLITIRLLYR